jgi:hypothetical protein
MTDRVVVTSPVDQIVAEGVAALKKATPDQIATLRRLTKPFYDDCIKRIVAAAPPLTPEQRDKLAVLLRLES